MSRRGEPAPSPARASEWKLMLATNDAAKGWDTLCRQVPGPLAALYDRLTSDPRQVDNVERQGRLKGDLGTASIRGNSLEQWQYEITGGGRVWYAPDSTARTVWITLASAGHPKATD